MTRVRVSPKSKAFAVCAAGLLTMAIATYVAIARHPRRKVTLRDAILDAATDQICLYHPCSYVTRWFRREQLAQLNPSVQPDSVGIYTIRCDCSTGTCSMLLVQEDRRWLVIYAPTRSE